MVERYADLLNLKMFNLPFIYVGLPIGASHRRKGTGKPIIQKFSKKLALWKHKQVSFGGRNLVAIQRKSNGVVVKKTNKIAWFSWSDICKSKELGGLGVKDFISFNHALLGMWRWNLFHQKDCLWEDVLNSKYER